MLQTLIDIERERFAKMGYDSVVTTDEIMIDTPCFTKSLGNDTLIITGIVMSEDDVHGENSRISITSANDAITSSIFNFSSFGTSVLKTMRQYLDVCRFSTAENQSFVMTLQAIKITPKLRS